MSTPEEEALDDYASTIADRDTRVLRALAVGMAKAEVASRTGLSRSTIDRLIKAHGIDIHAVANNAAELHEACLSAAAFGSDPEEEIKASRTPDQVEVFVSRGERELAYTWAPSEKEWRWVREGALARLRAPEPRVAVYARDDGWTPQDEAGQRALAKATAATHGHEIVEE